MFERPCECEHQDHFGRGHKAHPYGQQVSEDSVVKFHTPWGTFAVCPECANSCCVSATEHGLGEVING